MNKIPACLETSLLDDLESSALIEPHPKPQHQFGALPQPEPDEPNRSVRVCIASPDIFGPIYNGGIGTAYAALSAALVRAGNEVTILYPHGNYSETKSLDHWIQYYRERNIHFVPLPEPTELLHPGMRKKSHIRKSYGVFQWLKQYEANFDLVHFVEWGGVGFYSLLAKHQGLAFEHLNMVVCSRSPTSWCIEGNREYINRKELLEIDFMERESVRLADVLISPSQYMLHWLNKNGWKLPKHCYVQPNVLPEEPPIIDYSQLRTVAINEIVFFGRLETRKGLVLFCDAIDKAPVHTREDLLISFLGKVSSLGNMRSQEYIRSRAQNWKCRINIMNDKNRHEAVDYLRGPGRAAVIPSLLDNTPNTVLECLSQKIPFISSDVGGAPELIDEQDRERICFKPEIGALAQKLDLIVEEGLRPSKPRINFVDNERAWMRWHQTQLKNPEPRRVNHFTTGKEALVSVCLTHFNRPRHLARALESIRRQDYSNFEVVLVDDGSTLEEALSFLRQIEPEFIQRGWKLFPQNNRFLGAARNSAASCARGEYILFMDDDNIAEPNEISTFVDVALKTNADILTCAMNTFKENETDASNIKAAGIWPYLGPAAAAGALSNPFGDANALIRKSAFEELGGFIEDRQITAQDREFFARAVLRGYRLETIPVPLYRYRICSSAMLRTGDPAVNQWRVMQTYQSACPSEFQNLLSLLGSMNGQFGAPDSTGNPQEIVNKYWRRQSWRFTRPMRNLVNALRGRPPEQEPKVQTWMEAWEIISKIEDSASWNLTGPLRAIGKATKNFRRALRRRAGS
ncbi:MAG TPA: glycosyltransferase [Phycisphaerae bacterium]|nr:glycosyltransferase [Phycisphaerae bacterium]